MLEIGVNLASMIKVVAITVGVICFVYIIMRGEWK